MPAGVRTSDVVRLRVKELVAQRGVTWQAFGEETGLSKQTVYALMTNKITRLDLRTLAALCAYFAVGPGEILEYRP
jgi:DNA-binding Xre family transcriptional regulator